MMLAVNKTFITSMKTILRNNNMTKLSTHIPIEYIKQSKELQAIKCDNLYRRTFFGTGRKEKPYLVFPNSKGMWLEGVNDNGELRQYPASTIADIIDNAEMLFSTKTIFSNSWGRTDTGRAINETRECDLISMKLLNMCQQNKSIEEISEYIIDNIPNRKTETKQ